MLILNIRVPGEPLRRVKVDRPLFTLGRSSTNDVPLADRTLSRAHARIENRDGAGVWLVDLGSRNGTAHNGTRIEFPVALAAGDRILLGETVIDVSDEATTRVVIEAREEDQNPSETTIYRSSRELVAMKVADERLGRDELKKLADSLRILSEVSAELLRDIPQDKLLDLLLERLFSYLEPDRGVLMLADEKGELKPAALRFAPGVDPDDIRLSRTIVNSVIERKNGVLMIDTQNEADSELGTADSIRLQGITSCLAAPLFVDEEVIGLVYLEARLHRKSFTEDDLRLLTSLSSTAAIKIQNLRLQEQAVAKERIEREMALAWDVQRRLLPERDPDLPNSEIVGRTTPSRTVSGDYFDFFERADRLVDVVVADVCGKGMAASILAASVQSAFQAWAAESFPPDRLCARLNDLVFRRTNPEKFVTMFVALYDPESGAVLWTNAGHNPGLLVRARGEVERLGPHGPPLGLFPGKPYGSGSFTMRTDDLLVLYTDGVTEAANAEDEEFGLERLTEVCVEARRRSVPEIEEEIRACLDAFVGGTPFADDRTLVLLKRV